MLPFSYLQRGLHAFRFTLSKSLYRNRSFSYLHVLTDKAFVVKFFTQLAKQYGFKVLLEVIYIQD